MPKSAEWYLALGLIAAGLIAAGILLKNFLFAGVVVLATLALLSYANRVPRIVRVSLEDSGVRFGENFYSYDTLATFGIDESARLLLKKKTFFALLVVIPIVGIHPNLVRAALREFLSEEDLQEPLAQRVFEYLGF